MKSNLEPIEEKDLDFESKIRRPLENLEIQAEKDVFTNVENESSQQEISSAEKDNAYGKILSAVQQTDDTTSHAEVASDAQIGAQKIDAESQIQHLIDIAQQKGVFHAVKVARHMQDNYVLDTMHDRMLADELHGALVEKGMIKEI